MNGKNILVISPLWSGMKSFFFEGNKQTSGMPAFNNVFQGLLEDDEVATIYLILFIGGYSKAINIPEEHTKLKVIPIFYLNPVMLVFRFIGALISLKRKMKQWKIDVIFSHGSIGALGVLLKKITGVKCVQRIYGTFLINEIDKSKLSIFLRHPFEYIAFAGGADHIVITNDGTHGDRVFYKLANPKKSQLHFLINGINKDKLTAPFKDIQLPKKYICYMARIDTWKRQHILIDALITVKEKMGEEIPAFIVGQKNNKKYFSELEQKVNENGLKENIIFTGGIQSEQAAHILKHATISCSFYHTSNFGNVVLESVTFGVPTLGINCNESLDALPDDVIQKIDYEEPEKVAERIYELWNNDQQRKTLHEKSVAFAETQLKNWSERVSYETKLLLND